MEVNNSISWLNKMCIDLIYNVLNLRVRATSLRFMKQNSFG